MTQSLRIVVADDERNMHEYLQEALPRLGHEVVGVAQTGRELVEICRKLQPDLIITDIKMPDMDGLAASEEICRETPIPVIVVSAYHDPQFIERATQNHVLAYLLKPIRQHDLEPAISMAMRRFEQFQTLRRETTDLRQALDERKIVERAKGLLMKREHIDEQEAFRRLQKLAMNQNRKLIEVAQMVLSVSDAFEPGPSK